MSPVALHGIIADVLALLRHGLEVDSVALNFHLDKDVPLVWADAHQLHHVIRNLITNAHHALRQSDVPRHLTFTTMANAERTQVTLEISDTGSGIPEELQRRIFEPFFTTKTPDVGSSLGLLLCRNIIESHGGTLYLQSQAGDGTRVSMTLPVANADVQAPQERAVSAETPPAQHGAILLIDDEPGMQQALRRLLQRNGQVITITSSGRCFTLSRCLW